jgi:hypothetical protein
MLAVVVNITVSLTALGAIIAAAVGVIRLLRRLWPARPEPIGRPEATVRTFGFERPDGLAGPLAAKLQSRWVKFAVTLAGFIAAVSDEGRQGPVARALGIRLVDARTGRPITLRQKVIRGATIAGWQALVQRFFPRPDVWSREENREAAEQIKLARQRHGDDRAAFEAAVMRFYNED